MSDDLRREDLLRLLLDRDADSETERTASLLEARNDPDASAVLAEYDRVLAAARAGDLRDDWSPRREKDFVKRVLAETTREDLRWRGDAKLVLAFVRDRVKSSPALRVLAASIVACFFASGYFAWLAVQEPEKDLYITFDIPLEMPDEVSPSDESPVVPDAPIASEDPERRAWEIENTLARDRYRLAAWQPTDATPMVGEADSLALRLLHARAAAGPHGLTTEEVLEAAHGLERTLLAELLLDDLARTGEVAAILPRVLQRLSREEAGPDRKPAVRTLAAMALDRARAYGRWDWEADLTPASEVRDPFAKAWHTAVVEALPAELREHPVVLLW